MIDKKTAEVKHAKKIIARIFQRDAVINFITLLPSVSCVVIFLQWQNHISEIFAIIFLVISFTYLFDLLLRCLYPYLTIKKMINWYALDAKDNKELIKRLKIISAIIRFDLLFDGKITLWKIAKESRITKIDVSPFKDINHLSTNDVNDKIINNNIFRFRWWRCVPILNVLSVLAMMYLLVAPCDVPWIKQSFKTTTGINIERLWRPKKKQ